MSAHTKEPWTLGKVLNGYRWINAVGHNGLAQVVWQMDDDAVLGEKSPEQEANAHRIVASVNACAGIPTEALEAGVIAELVEALEAAVPEIDVMAGWVHDESIRGRYLEIAARARAILTKAKGDGHV